VSLQGGHGREPQSSAQICFGGLTRLLLGLLLAVLILPLLSVRAHGATAQSLVVSR